MRAQPEKYNPSKHGICAKIWECLRRNRRFRKDVAEFRRQVIARGYILDFNTPFIDALRSNPFVSPVWLALVAYKKIGDVEERAWPDLPLQVRECFADTLEKSIQEVKSVRPPPVAQKGKSVTERDMEIAYQWCCAQQFLWNRSEVVAIPKFILHTEHKKQLKDALNKLVDEASKGVLNSLKFRDGIPSGGKLLGTKRDWDLLLYINNQRRRGLSLREALFLSASIYAGERNWTEAWSVKSLRDSEQTKKDLRQAWGERGSKVKQHLSAIRQGIRGVYPSFTVFWTEDSIAPSTLKK